MDIVTYPLGPPFFDKGEWNVINIINILLVIVALIIVLGLKKDRVSFKIFQALLIIFIPIIGSLLILGQYIFLNFAKPKNKSSEN